MLQEVFVAFVPVFVAFVSLSVAFNPVYCIAFVT